MEKHVIGLYELEGWEESTLREQLGEHELVLETKPLLAGEAPARTDLTVLCVFVNSEVNETVLSQFPNLQLVTTRTTGFDHIDLDACRKRNIKVAYVPGYGDNTVAEFTFGLMLALVRRVYDSVRRMKESGEFSPKGLRGMDLKGKTLGVVGTGRIGQEVIHIAKGFSMQVVASDPFPNEAAAKELGYTYTSLDELLASADIVTLHVPYRKETHHLLNHENLPKIKQGAYLVNTARGGVVETDALISALSSGQLAGAALDVLEEEGEVKDEIGFLQQHPKEEELKTMLQNHVLMRMPNVLVTPHNAFNTQEALERILHITLKNITGHIAGTPKNLVPDA